MANKINIVLIYMSSKFNNCQITIFTCHNEFKIVKLLYLHVIKILICQSREFAWHIKCNVGNLINLRVRKFLKVSV